MATHSVPKNRANLAAVPSVSKPAPIAYPPDTEDRLCSVAGSILGAVSLIEHLPDGLLHGDLLNVLHMLQLIEKEVRAINHSAVELQEVARG
jgi:hypothetical protein